jgi:hypothetical protein
MNSNLFLICDEFHLCCCSLEHLKNQKCYDFWQPDLAMCETGLMADPENSEKMATYLQGGHAGEDGSICAACLGNSACTCSSPMGMKLVLVTLDTDLQWSGDQHVPCQPAGNLRMTTSPITPGWCSTWAQLPHQKGVLLPAEVTRAKLHQICEIYRLIRWLFWVLSWWVCNVIFLRVARFPD